MAWLGPEGPDRDIRGGRRTPQDRLPGGQSNVRLMQGMEGVLRTNEAASQEISRAAQEMRINSERTARMTASIDTVVREQRAVATAITQAVSVLTSGLGLPGGPSVGPPPSASPHPAGPPAPPRPPSGDYQRPAGDPGPSSTWLPPGAPPDPVQPINTMGVPQGADPVQARENWERLQSGRGYSIGNLRRDAGREIGRRVSGTRIGPRLTQDRNGQWMRTNEAGEILGQASDADLRNMRIANQVRTIGGQVATQGVARGLVNALPQTAGRVLGGGAAALAVVNQGLDIAESQRAQNAYWQSISGDDNLSGFGERISANLFRLGQRGTMSGAQADALYKGVYEMGLGREERDNALDFATQNWRRFGMEVNESLKILREAAESGQTGLVGVAEALDNVTESAKEAGVNANVYRQMFTQNFQASAGTLTGTGTAATASGALASAQALLGTQFQNIDTTGMFNTSTLRQFAALSGQNLTQYLGSNQGSSGAANIIAAGQTQVLRIAQNALGQEGLNIIQRWKQQRGVTGKLSNEQANQVATAIMQSEVGRRIDPEGLLMQLRTMAGINVTDINDAIPFLIMALDGGWDPGREAAEQVKKSAMQSVTDTASGRQSLAKDLGLGISSEVVDNLPKANSGSAIGKGLGGLFHGDDSMQRTAGDIYYEQARETGQYSPIVAKLLQEEKNNRGRRFAINVGDESNPQYREMDLKDAIRYHSDQLARGEVMIRAGAGKDQSVAEALGFTPNEDIDVEYSGAGKGKGSAIKDQTTAQGGVAGTVLISATPELQRLLRLTTTGGAAYTEQVPSSIIPGSALPTGNGY